MKDTRSLYGIFRALLCWHPARLDLSSPLVQKPYSSPSVCVVIGLDPSLAGKMP